MVDKKLHPSQKTCWKVSLPWMLIVPFILQVVTVVGWVGYLSYRNGQQSVADLTDQLMDAESHRIKQELDSYLMSAPLANQINSNAVLRGDLSLDFNQLNDQREQYFWQHMKLFSNLAWISVGDEKDGGSLGIWRPGENQDLQFSLSNASTSYFGNYYAISDQGLRTTLLKVERPIFDARTRPWYKEAIAAKKAIWTNIYAGFSPGTVFIAASQPLYDRNGKLVGVSGSDISLIGIQVFLSKNPVSPTGKTFLLERSGMLVASSSQEPPFRKIEGKSPERVNVIESQTPLIRATAQSLRQKFGDFATIKQQVKFQYWVDGQLQFVQVVPFSKAQGLDWLIAIVVPESDVMAKIHAGTQTTILLCLAALIGAIVLNIAISYWLIKPIKSLSQASQKIARGDYSSELEVSEIRELHTLTVLFNQMSQEIQMSREQLEDYSRSLEQKVSDRTQELQAEVEQRTKAEIALQSANQELHRMAYLDGLTQIANRRQFDERLTQEWNRMKRDHLPMSLILCDVDYFKKYNDTYGHQAGDDCLRHVGQAITAAICRPADLAARYGGEEFATILPNTNLDGATKVARAIQAQIKELQIPHRSSDVSAHVTVSLGVVSLFPDDQTTTEQLLIKADQLLYQAKSEGRDRFACTIADRIKD
jgi:diguanylate cyclase (GGDEF)-like protein